MIELRSRDEIEAMRPAGRFVAAVLTELAERTRVGINELELDRIAHAMIREHRATSCYIDYHLSFGAMPFGKVLCVSVNDAVLHGPPHDRRLRDGDLVSLDFAAEVDGWTIRSVYGSRGVHVEHTVAITADGPLVLTARDAVAASELIRATA